MASSSAAALAQETYENAVKLLQAQLTQDETKRRWLHGKSSMNDVQKAVDDARTQYESQTGSKARKYLAAFSSRVMHYCHILDMLVQHHPEYTALVWGTTKLLFVVSVSSQRRDLRKLTWIASDEPRGNGSRIGQGSLQNFGRITQGQYPLGTVSDRFDQIQRRGAIRSDHLVLPESVEVVPVQRSQACPPGVRQSVQAEIPGHCGKHPVPRKCH